MQVENSPSTCIPDGHLQRVTIPDAVLVQFDLLMMITTLLETCRGLFGFMFQINAPFVYYIYHIILINIINKLCIKLEYEIKYY